MDPQRMVPFLPTYLDTEVQGGVQAGQHINQNLAHEDAGRLVGEDLAAPGPVVP